MNNTTRLALLAVAAIVLLSAGAAVVAFRWVTAGGALPRLFRGEVALELVAVADTDDAAHDAPIVAARLTRLGVDADVTVRGARHLRIALRNVDGSEAARASLQRGALSFHFIALDQSPLRAALATLPTERDYDGTDVPSAPSRQALEQALAGFVPPPGTLVRAESRARAGVPPTYLAWLLEAAPILTNGDVVDASVQDDEVTGAPTIALSFSPAGARRFGDATAAGVGRKLAICSDDVIQSAPVVREAIRGGHAVITLGNGEGPETSRRGAVALAAAFQGEPLAGRWVLESEATLRP